MDRIGHDKKRKIMIIGGGASGMMAAIAAARQIGGDQVQILERNNILGRKLLATGNGRCNITNRFSGELLSKAASAVYASLDVSATVDFFDKIGLLMREEEEGRMYPYSEQAVSVVETLASELAELSVKISFNTIVKDLFKQSEGYKIIAEKKNDRGEREQLSFFSEKVILAAGGKAGPQYGTVGDSFSLGKRLGLQIITPFPSLTQLLVCDESFPKLKGIRGKGKVTLLREGEPIDTQKGEVQFTAEGLSGICIFNLSRAIRLKGYRYEDYAVSIDFFPEFTALQVEEMLRKRVSRWKERDCGGWLQGMINKRIGEAVLKAAHGADREASSQTSDSFPFAEDELRNLAKVFKGWTLTVSGTKGWKEAQVTCGGIALNELNERTLEAKNFQGLYVAGEALDFDGICGGYNLQWAWSSGYCAGSCAATS